MQGGELRVGLDVRRAGAERGGGAGRAGAVLRHLKQGRWPRRRAVSASSCALLPI